MTKKIVKRTGAVVDFDKSILERSLRRAGADVSLARNIASDIEADIVDGDTAARIYEKAFEMLSESSRGCRDEVFPEKGTVQSRSDRVSV